MKVSVLIPAYNVEQYINECLTSVCHQSYRDLQIVVFDDGSTDGTLKIITDFKHSDNRIEVHTRKNKGVAATRNDLLKEIKGDAFIFIDADDWIEPNMIETLVHDLEETGCAIAMCGLINDGFTDAIPETREIWTPDQVVIKFLFHKELTGSLWNKLIRISSLNNNRFQEEISYGEDALFLWGIIKNGTSIIKSDSPLYHYRTNLNSLTYRRFGEGKFSGGKVWASICKDIETDFPQYVSLARAQYAHQITMLLFDAARCRYKSDDIIISLRQILKQNLSVLRKSGIEDNKKFIFAVVASQSYSIASTLVKLFYSSK